MYVPYTGGAGPSKEQEDDNNTALAMAVTILTTKRVTRKIIQYDEGDVSLAVVVGDRAVSYDRWGFCAEECSLGMKTTSKERLDQVSIGRAIDYLLAGE
jgi:hypothetical protein